MSLDEAKELELQDRCCAERLELDSWSVSSLVPRPFCYAHAREGKGGERRVWEITIYPRTGQRLEFEKSVRIH